MAICHDCGEDMLESDGCAVDTICGRNRIKYGEEMYAKKYGLSKLPCHDCNAKPGHFHHLGCDMERCPNCGGQLISCGCFEF